MVFSVYVAQHLGSDVDGEEIVSNEPLSSTDSIDKDTVQSHSRIGEESRASDTANLHVEPTAKKKKNVINMIEKIK